MTRLERYLQNEAVIQELEAELESRKKARRSVEADLIEELLQGESSKVSFQGQTFYLKTGTHLTVEPGATVPAVVKAIRARDERLARYVGFRNTDRLAALLDTNPEYQVMFQGLLGVYKTHHLRSRKQNG